MVQTAENDLKMQLHEAATLRDQAWGEFERTDLSEREKADDALRRYYEHSDRYRELRHEQQKLRDARERESLDKALYEYRPETGFLGLLSRPLGPLPKYARTIQPSKEDLDELPSYRLPAFLLVIGAITLLIGLAFAAPWLVVSPWILLSGLFTDLFGRVLGIVLAITVMTALLLLVTKWDNSPRYSEGRFLDRAAMQEEQWFRMGAESWTTRQRMYSSIAFGAVHITNMIYPVTSVLVLMLVGAVFMAAYLREYRRSGDTRRATLAATKLHATYNRFAFLYMIAALTVLVVVRAAS